MAFFKIRWPGQNAQQHKPAQRSRAGVPESVEVMRRRARHRLIGAAVLLLLGVIGFPLLFDTQPRPVPANISIEIPDRNKVAPFVVPASSPAAAPLDGSVSGPVVPAASSAKEGNEAGKPASAERSAAAQAGLDSGEELVPAPVAKPVPKSAAVAPAASRPQGSAQAEPKSAPSHKPDASAFAPPAAKHETKAPSVVPAERKTSPDEAARVRALLEGGAADSSVAGAGATQTNAARFVVQVGAFADADKAREVRTKLERAGLKTYTQVLDTKDGKRTRVRVGPFASKAEADKAAARIHGLGLSASVLGL